MLIVIAITTYQFHTYSVNVRSSRAFSSGIPIREIAVMLRSGHNVALQQMVRQLACAAIAQLAEALPD